ncbi:metabotropic glutamate receptor 1 [Amyelois transitella]|uniref:metabotropic glutamate receptor 1 n=1 Tax=Amyelois transitella TaxID=680683 RepID=UPI0029905226|nr:metabotropic glutamate receptor 1 [Amyelois transitella]XP_060801447.1 metabotropic glutamate receptor 1 [Amyelois transitella]
MCGESLPHGAVPSAAADMWLALAAAAALAASAAGGGAARAEVRGAVRFGALFAVHGAPAAAVAGARCGAVREHYGIQRVEATLRALDAINADRQLLPGLAVGAELRDSCWAAPTALRQTIDLVRDAIAPPDHASAERVCLAETPGPAAAAPLLGVLGPGASAAAVQVQNLLQLFSIPQVSYSATSRELSDRARFSTFFRMVPPDQHQARLLVALLRAHNWTYVHAVHTDESYGQSGMAAFREEAARGGVCVAREEALRGAPSAREVDGALRRLAAGPRVAVCWCEGRTARALLQGLQRRAELAQASGESPPLLRLVGSDGWADRRDVVAGLEPAARLALTLRIRSPYLHDFDRYYHALTPHNNKRNPWFQEFWEQKFNCSLETEPAAGVRKCTGSESLTSGYTQEPKLALVVRGVYAFAHALHDMRRALCPASREPLCAAMLPFNVTLYRRHLARVRFRAPDGGLVAFDDNGDPPPELSEYDVMNLVSDGAGGWRYVRVGRWRRGALRLRGGDHAAARRAAGVRGACGAACAAGQWRRAGRGRARCCWTCESCPPLAVVARPDSGCRLCPPGHRPDLTRTHCLPSPIEWGSGGRWARSVAGAAGASGLVAVAMCATTFWRHRNTPVVKSASRELCVMLLCAAAACHVAALAAAARPAAVPCAAVRAAAPALGGVYAAILARTLRVARLVAAVEKRPTSRPRLLSSRAQVWMWVCLSSPGAVLAAWAAARWPPGTVLLHPGRARAVLACGGERAEAQLPPLAPALLLLAACVILAIRTRRLPHNLNETRFVGAAAYATGVTWLAFFPLYAAAEARTATLGACASLSAGACVLLSLGPRVFVCLFRPARNTRQHFLTATSIRCHLGKYRPDNQEQANVACATSPPKQKVSASAAVQTEETREACREESCAAAGACARVLRTAGARADGEEYSDVLIVLMQHHHTIPPGITDLH